MAVIEYKRQSEIKDVFPMHAEIKAHFDVIWDNATIPIGAYWSQDATGLKRQLDSPDLSTYIMSPPRVAIGSAPDSSF